MTQNLIDYKELSGLDAWEVFIERHHAPFDDIKAGVIFRDIEGYYRFRTAPGAELCVGDLRRLMTHIGEMNDHEHQRG